MPVLHTLKMERFAQLIAKGHNQSEAARLVGYSKERAAQQGSNLRKHRKVAARIAELVQRAEEHVATSVAVSKDWVVQGLIRTIDEARAEKQFSVVRQCFVDIGKELGMFTERVENTLKWDGDPAKLGDRELGTLTLYLEKLGYGEKLEVIKEERRKVLMAAGLMIEGSVDKDTAAEEITPTIAAVEDDKPVDIPKSWSDITDPNLRRRLAAEWKARGPAGPPNFVTREERIKWLDENWPLTELW